MTKEQLILTMKHIMTEFENGEITDTEVITKTYLTIQREFNPEWVIE